MTESPTTTQPQSATQPLPRMARLTGLLGTPPRRLNLALQGGGSHGAFTWGVLDQLLQDPDITFEGLSGSSAGAMNAVVLADGWLKGGRDGARQGLAQFWTEVGRHMPWESLTRGEGEAISLSPASKLLANWAGYFSPSQLNPFDLNPLRDLLLRQVDFDRLRTASPFKLFIGTTQVSTGKLRLFREHELTVDVVLASACLPKLHHAVEIDGEPYWDGGYCANPAVFPLVFDCETRDILLVLLSPLEREGTPHTVGDIETRITELAFDANFKREMQLFIHAAACSGPSFLRWGRLERKLHKLHFHMIDSNQLLSLQRTETKLIAHGPFLELLHQQGQQRAAQWMAAHTPDIGRRSSVDVARWFS